MAFCFPDLVELQSVTSTCQSLSYHLLMDSLPLARLRLRLGIEQFYIAAWSDTKLDKDRDQPATWGCHAGLNLSPAYSMPSTVQE